MDDMGSLEDEGDSAVGAKVKELYFDILNCKGTKASYEEEANEVDERKHVKKLNKQRAKNLRKQQKKLEKAEKKFINGELGSDDDDDAAFFMQDASIRAAQREFEAAKAD